MKQEDILQHIADVKSHLSLELSKIRSGRANPGLVETILVEAYAGSPPLPINELATITVPEPQSILITPWDKSVLGKIEQAIIKSQKGFNPINEGSDIRVPIPALTEERRKEIAKDVSVMVENAKISVRNVRQDAMKSVEEQEENGIISEDEMHRLKKQFEETFSKSYLELEDIGRKKEEEVMTI